MTLISKVAVVAAVLFLALTCVFGYQWHAESNLAAELTAQLVETKNQNTQLSSTIADLSGELAKLKAENSGLAANAATATEQAKAEAVALATPVVPVTISWRRAFTGPGLVAAFHNSSDKTLSVLVLVFNPTAKRQREFSLALPQTGNGAAEIGYGQGWAFASGDQLTVKSDGYRDVSAVTP